MSFHEYMRAVEAMGDVAVQPRMGFSDFPQMRRGLERVRDFSGSRVATLTLDAKSRQRQFAEAAASVAKGEPLNGWPIATYPVKVTHNLIDDIQRAGCPVQLRHGSPQPLEVLRAAAAAGIDASEGGPVSYCLPYGKVPLADSTSAWHDAAQFWAEAGARGGVRPHMESFGGCMMSQLCPPSQLVAISVLEGAFFVSRGILSVSLSAAQGTNNEQDVGAVIALRRLARRYLPRLASWHICFYTFMGLFPQTREGARRIISDSAKIATVGGAQRIIVKTAVESVQIPSVDDNLEAMAWTRDAARAASKLAPSAEAQAHAQEIEDEARALIEAILGLKPDIGDALVMAFAKGYLDVPFCIHPDNRNTARAAIDPSTGVIRWVESGRLPLSRGAHRSGTMMTSHSLLRSLRFNQMRYDGGMS